MRRVPLAAALMPAASCQLTIRERVRTFGILLLVLWVVAAQARAESPACFPSRVLTQDTTLEDEHGRPFGTTWKDLEVSVLASGLGERGDRSRVRIQQQRDSIGTGFGTGYGATSTYRARKLAAETLTLARDTPVFAAAAARSAIAKLPKGSSVVVTERASERVKVEYAAFATSSKRPLFVLYVWLTPP